MADFRIQVIVDPRGATAGAQKVNRELNKVGSTADRVKGLIGRAFAFAGLTIGVRQIISLADSFTTIQNRVKTVTTGVGELNAVTDELFDISNRTRSSFQATAEVYTRTALATRELGISQKDTLEFVESLNQAVILSGANAVEAKAGLIQLSQGLASGALRGDELRSVLEQLPVVSDVIAKSLGVTRGQLREMGTQGRITAEVIIEAFKEAREELAVRFGETVPTIGQAFTILNNQLIRLIGDFTTTTGLASGLASAITTLAFNLETVARVATAAGIALSINLAVRGIGAVIRAIGALTIAIATNPIGAILTALTVGISLLIAFGDKIDAGTEGFANIHDVGVAAFNAISKALGPLIELFKIGFHQISLNIGASLEDGELSFKNFLLVVARVIDNIVGLFKGLDSIIPALLSDLPTAIELIFKDAFNKVLRAFTTFLNFINKGLSKVRESFGQEAIPQVDAFQLELSGKAQDLGIIINDSIARGISESGSATAAVLGILDDADVIAQERIDKLAADRAAAAGTDLSAPGTKASVVDLRLEEIIKRIKDQGEALRLNNQEREIQLAFLKAEKAFGKELLGLDKERVLEALRINQQIADEVSLLDRLRGPQEDLARGQEALNRLLDQGAISTAEFAQEMRLMQIEALSFNKDVISGIRLSLLELEEEYSNLSDSISDVVTNAFSGMEDALTDFVTTGKLSFKSLIDSMIQDITRLAIQQSITKPLLAFASAAFAPGGGGASFLPGFANGGSFVVGGNPGVDRNTLSVNGRAVARVGNKETVTVSPEGSQRPIQINYHINTPDANSFQRSQSQILAKTSQVLGRANRRDT